MRRALALASLLAAAAAALLAACGSAAADRGPSGATALATSPTATAAASTGGGADGGGGTGGGGGGGSGGGRGQQATQPPAGTVILTLTRDGRTVKTWTRQALEAAVPFQTLTIDGDVQNGPTLLDVLKDAGVTGWTSAEVTGKGPSRAFEVTLTVQASKVNAKWILDVTREGTIKLAADGLPREQWVRDVTKIQVK